MTRNDLPMSEINAVFDTRLRELRALELEIRGNAAQLKAFGSYERKLLDCRLERLALTTMRRRISTLRNRRADAEYPRPFAAFQTSE